MKNKFRFLFVFSVLIICLLITAPVFAQTPTPGSGTTSRGDKLVLADTYRLENGDTLEGNLVVIGSTVSIAQTANLKGDIVIIGGTISIEGTINGDILVIGGAANLDDTAVVNGDIVTTGASFKKSPLAQVTGNITEQTPTVFNFDNKGLAHFPFQSDSGALTQFLMVLLESLGMAVFAVIIGLFLPEQTKRVSKAIMDEPLVTGGVGLLTLVCVPILLVLITITIILIPITILATIIFALAILFGWLAVGYEIGERIGSLFHAVWSVPVASGIGVLLLSLVVGTLNMLPCIGWIFGFIIIIFGLGAVVTSRFGSSKYAKKIAQAVISAPPPTPTPETPNSNSNNTL